MSAALKPPMTVDEFLDWEERQPVRYEFDGVRAFAMVGGSLLHSAIKVNLVSALAARLRGKPCRAFDSDAKVRVAGSIRYPDASVTCSRQTVAKAIRQGLVCDPVVVFEVLSAGTSARDRTEKNAEYRATPSIQRYVMVEPERVAATVFSRAGGDWVGHLLVGEDAAIALPELDVEPIRLADLYEGIDTSYDAEADGGDETEA